jgi:hypothetical protein
VFLTKNQDRELLHKRLGHSLDKVLRNVFKLYIKRCINCDVCKLAKQTRLQFLICNSKSNDLFDLIHSDIWHHFKLFVFFNFYINITLVFFNFYIKKNKNQLVTLMLQKKWCQAMHEELNALEKNKTWVIISLPKKKS